MSATLTITVPEETTSTFVVTTDRPDDVPPLPSRLVEPFAAEAAKRLGTAQLSVATFRAPDSPWDLGGSLYVHEEHDPPRTRETVREAAHHIGVSATVPVDDQPFGAQLARAVARAIADAVAGTPIDLDTGQVLPFLNAIESSQFLLADEWLGVWLPPYSDITQCAAAGDDCTCVELITRGMSRFGLPELQMTAVGCQYDLAALNLLRTTAQRLLPLGRTPGTHILPRQISLTSGDFGAYWGTSEPMWSGGPLSVRLTPLHRNLLRVGPPTDWPSTQNEWLWDEVPPVLYDLLSYGSEAPPLTSTS
jgi:hypothetical protein